MMGRLFQNAANLNPIRSHQGCWTCPPHPPHIPNHIALIVPRSRVAASATEWRSSARRTRCTAPNSAAASETGREGGWRAERSHFQLFLNRKLELEVGRVCVVWA
jgi:hypothetical protein